MHCVRPAVAQPVLAFRKPIRLPSPRMTESVRSCRRHHVPHRIPFLVYHFRVRHSINLGIDVFLVVVNLPPVVSLSICRNHCGQIMHCKSYSLCRFPRFPQDPAEPKPGGNKTMVAPTFCRANNLSISAPVPAPLRCDDEVNTMDMFSSGMLPSAFQFLLFPEPGVRDPADALPETEVAPLQTNSGSPSHVSHAQRSNHHLALQIPLWH